MNFSVHLNDELFERLNQTARESGKTRNALIREVVGEWLNRRRPAKWPTEVMNFQGIRGIRRFEEDRKNLKPPRQPFDARELRAKRRRSNKSRLTTPRPPRSVAAISALDRAWPQ